MPGLTQWAKDFTFLSLGLLDQCIFPERQDFYTEDIIKHCTNIYERSFIGEYSSDWKGEVYFTFTGVEVYLERQVPALWTFILKVMK